MKCAYSAFCDVGKYKKTFANFVNFCIKRFSKFVKKQLKTFANFGKIFYDTDASVTYIPIYMTMCL